MFDFEKMIEEQMQRIVAERERMIFEQAKQVKAIADTVLICSRKNAVIVKSAMFEAGINNVTVIVTDLCEDDKCYMLNKNEFEIPHYFPPHFEWEVNNE